MIYYTNSIKGVDFNLCAATLNQTLDLKVNLIKVCYASLSDFANACFDNFFRFKVRLNNK